MKTFRRAQLPRRNGRGLLNLELSLWFFALVLLLAFFPSRARADYTVVDTGTSQAFTAPASNATAFAWTLDGAAVGTNSATFNYSPDVNAVGTHDLIVTQTLASGSTSAAEWGVRVRIPVPASSIQYYVSTTGSDSNNGSIGAPFKTLEAARNAIRSLSRPLPAGGVTVYLRGGTHYRTAAFVLSSQDSGESASAPVIYTSYPGETAILNAGKPLLASQWSPLAATEQGRLPSGVNAAQIWEADATALGLIHKGPFPTSFSEWPIYNANNGGSGGLCELFYNGKRMWMSRYPNHNLSDETQTPNMVMNGVVAGAAQDGTGYLNAAGNYTDSGGNVVAVGGAFQYNTADASHVSRWQTALSKGGIWLQGYWRVPWQISGAQVLGFDITKQVIEIAPGGTPAGGFGGKYNRPVGSKAEPFWVLNLLEEMDQAGEWAMDFSRNKIYFMMDTPNTPPADNSVLITDLSDPVIKITGSNVIVQSLTIQNSLAAGVQILGGSRDLVMGCTFSNIGNAAVDVNNTSGGSFNGVVSCDMSQLASAGVLLSGGNSTALPRVAANDFAVNNNVQTYSQVVRVYTPAVNVGYNSTAVGMRAAHNSASGTPHVSMLWNGYDHTLEYNDFSNYCQFSNDMGGIYTYNSNYVSNTTIRYNYLHHSPHGEGVYFDSDHINATVYGNVSNLHTDASEKRGYGFYDQVPGTTSNGMPVTDTRYNNIAVNNHYGFQIYSGTGGVIESNLTYNNTSTAFLWNLITVSGTTQSVSSSSASVLASGSNTAYTAEPGFMNFAADDLRLRPDSRVFMDMPKFRQIPLEMAGNYNDEYRRNIAIRSPFVTSAPASPAPGASFTLNGVLNYPQFDGGTMVSVYWGTTDGGTTAANWQNVVNLGAKSGGPVSTVLSGLSTSTTYYYRFYAANTAGTAWATSSVTVLPPPTAAPTGVTARAGHNQAVISWNAVANATSYNVKRSTISGSGYVTVANVTTGTTYTDAAVADGTTYYYVVSALSSTAETANSTEVVAAPAQLPVGWANQDLGNVAFAGSSSVDPYGTYTVAGSGADIWNSADACQFAGIPWSGDGVLVARIVDFTNTNRYTKVGVMFRETLLANAKNAYAGAVGQGTFVMQKRITTGGTSANSGSTTGGSLPHWVKLVRSGNTFTAYQSPTTSPAWTILGSAASVTMASNCYAGLAVSAHDNTKLCTAHFDNVIFLATPSFTTGLGQVTLTWLNSTGATSYLVQRSTTNGSGYATVATLPAGSTTYTDTGLTNGTAYYYVITAVSDTAGLTADSPQIAVQPGVLNVPSALTGTPGYSQASLAWNAATGAVSYNVKRSTTSGSGYATVATVSSGTTYVDNGVSNGTTYYYVVSAVSSWGAESANSSQVSVGVGPLQNIGFETPAQSAGGYTYNPAGGSWTFAAQSGTNGSGISANNSNFTKYNAVAPQGTQVAFVQGTGTLTQAVNGLLPGATYTVTFAATERYTNGSTAQKQTFQLKLDSTVLQTFAPNATGTGNTALKTGTGYNDYSVSLTATAATQTLSFVGTNTNTGDNSILLDNVRFVLQAPIVPTGVNVDSSYGQLTVSWNAAGGASGYNVKRSNSRTSGFVTVANVPAGTLSFADTVDSSLSTYYYKVSAVNPGGESADSTVAAAPVVVLPAPVLVIEATAPAGAVVNFTTSATDVNGNQLTTTATPASGSAFPLGDTAVGVVTSTDAAGSSTKTSFTVSVVDTTAPALTLPGNLAIEATSTTGASVTFNATAADLVDGSVPVTCTPASGTVFPFGITTVTATATDAAGNVATGSFTVSVADTTPPAITTPGNLYVNATSGNGVVVTFTTSATDAVSGTVPTTNTPASGSTFPVGATTVNVTASDAAGNIGSASFTVTVLPPPTTKLDNAIALNQAASWTSNKVPGTSDVAQWSGGYLSTSATVPIGTGITVERIALDGTVSRAITISNSGGGSLNLLGVSGTGLDMSDAAATGATPNLTVAAPVSLGSPQAWIVAAGRTLSVAGAIGESTPGAGLSLPSNGTVTFSGPNTYTGTTTVNAGKLTLSSGGTIRGNITVNQSSAASTANLVNNGSAPGGLTINNNNTAPTVVAVQGNANVTGNVTLNDGSSTGGIQNQGQLTLAGSTALLLGTISSPAVGPANALGAIFYNSTFNNMVNIADGSAFNWLSLGNSTTTAAVGTLQTTGTVYFFGFGGQSGSLNQQTAFTITVNGGTWRVGQLGQGNSGKTNGGTISIQGGAAFSVEKSLAWAAGAGQGAQFMHGVYNVGGVSGGSLTIVSDGFAEKGGFTTQPASGAISGLQINVGNGGAFSTGAASTLGFQATLGSWAGQTTTQTTNSLIVNSGGTASLTGNLNVNNTGAAQTNATTFNTVTVNPGGSLANNGVLYIGNNNLANTFLETDTVNVAGGTLTQTGGAVSLGNSGGVATNYANNLNITAGAMTVGTAASPQALQVGTNNNAATGANITNIVTLSGGKLVVSGLVSAFTGTSQTRIFNWSGGQLSAFTITPSANFAASSGTSGGITQTGLAQTAGTLAPGDVGIAGETIINGNYILGAAGTVAIDVGGTTQAAGFQTGQYDYVTVSGTTSLAGNLSVSLLTPAAFAPTNAQTFTVLSSSGSLSGAFSNVAFGNRVVTTGGEGSFVVTKSGNSVVLGSYLAQLPPSNLQATPGSAQAALAWSAPANAPAGTTYVVYRATISGGPYSLVASSLTATTYTDNNSGAGLTPGANYFYVVAASYGGISTPVSTEAATSIYTALQSWRQTYFGTAANAGSAANLADPDSDGLCNLIEYALGTSPVSAASKKNPVPGTSGNFLTLTFQRAQPDVSYIVEGSSDLVSWAAIATDPGTVGQTVTVTDTVPISSASPARRFLRLRVVAP